MSDDEERFEIVCRNREEFIDDYLMEVSEHDRDYCEELAIVLECLQENTYPKVISPKESILFD